MNKLVFKRAIKEAVGYGNPKPKMIATLRRGDWVLFKQFV